MKMALDFIVIFSTNGRTLVWGVYAAMCFDCFCILFKFSITSCYLVEKQTS